MFFCSVICLLFGERDLRFEVFLKDCLVICLGFIDIFNMVLIWFSRVFDVDFFHGILSSFFCELLGVLKGFSGVSLWYRPGFS